MTRGVRGLLQQLERKSSLQRVGFVLGFPVFFREYRAEFVRAEAAKSYPHPLVDTRDKSCIMREYSVCAFCPVPQTSNPLDYPFDHRHRTQGANI